jgi:hypothetical protein
MFKIKTYAKNTAYYGLAMPAAIVIDTATTAAVRLTQAAASTVAAPFLTAGIMIQAKRATKDFH